MTSTEPARPLPTLVEAPVTLRPWTPADAEPTGVPADEAHEWAQAFAEGEPSVLLVAEIDGVTAGTVTLTQLPGRDRTGYLTWSLPQAHPEHGSQALRLLLAWAYDELGLRRVETHVGVDDTRGIRVAARAGLRKEGVVRGYVGADGARTSAVLLARVHDDADPFSREGFIATLNAGLPTKRAIAQALIRNERGEVLLCELVYKKFWDLPGGVVDPGESPAHAVVREIREELSVDARIRSLAAVSWLPPWRGWDDATLFLFDVEVAEADIARAVLETREIRAVHWADEVTVKAQAADYTARLVERTVQQLASGAGTTYLENGDDPDWA